MGTFFGTDGIRGVANRHPMTPEFALKVGRAVASELQNGSCGRIVVGRDTRVSGDMLMGALAAGICASGSDVHDVGVLPTPGVAFLTRQRQAAAGIVISASHNPYTDNGIKVFDADGCKISEETENKIEQWILDESRFQSDASVPEPGRWIHVKNGRLRYQAFLRRTLPEDASFRDLKLVVDCSNGATSFVAPDILTDLGATIVALSAEPDGRNINADCGSEHPDALMKAVKALDADAGLAFDGDGDRLIAVDKKGDLLTGDQILAILAADMKSKGTLANQTVVTTVMSNMGFRAAMRQMGLTHLTAAVGDRNVMELMKKNGAVLGGEDSGHMILRNHHTTGDGILSALQLLYIMKSTATPLSRLAAVMTVYPQSLINVEVNQKPDLNGIDTIQASIRSIEKELGEQGRVLVRYSGTQPLCRIMVEAPTAEETHAYCRQLADVIVSALN